ncbi:T9SS type A sorting domain-containing protein [Rufibacter sp. XAAS-G3-1]|uniref:T9SS type A sorting domain-containing protein n=1 Tax=Rufibacter sp. XAAS-G3-1 TaxID=2729134 RepID=UPI0015E637C5|nr:T9SS type A sorting domain-containing protein [Rufibacter sp. XAAS-G3-1]
MPQYNYGAYNTPNRNWQNEVTLPGWSAQLGNANTTSIEITDGNVSAAGLKSYGSSDYNDNRSLGGFASTSNQLIYKVRFRNATGKSLTNIGLEFLLQQWFDGSSVSNLAIDYRITEPGSTTGTWNTVAALRGPVSSNRNTALNGNSSTNQKLVKEVLEGVVLKPNQELTIRWVNAVSSGKDLLAIDNFKLTTEEFKYVAPEVPAGTGKKVFYSSFWVGSELGDLSAWNTDPLTSDGETPTSFSTPNQVFVVQGPLLWGTLELTKNINLHASSKLVIGNGLLPVVFNIATNVRLKDVTVDVSALAVVNFDSKELPTLGSVHPTSTIVYKENSSEVKAGKYGNLRIDNKGVIKKLSNKVLITGQLELKNGAKLDIGDFDLVLGDSRKPVLYDALSFITTKGKGRLKMKLAPGDSAIFPVGYDNKALPVKLKLKTGSVADTFSIKVIDGVYTAYENNVPNGLSFNGQVVDKTWIIDEGVVGGTNLDMTLQWTAADMPLGATVPEDAFLMHYHKKQWDKGSAVKIVLQDGVYSLTRSNITSFSPFATASTSKMGSSEPIPLPVELTYFQAKRVSQHVQLNWATASEKDNDYFTIEQSYDGVTFQAVGKQVKGAGNSMVALTYSQELFDATPAKTQYFRLKQTDTDGAFEYSKTVALAPAKAAAKTQVKVGAYPNPTPDGKVNLEIYSASEEATITVFHSTGKVVLQKQVKLATGSPVALDLINQTAGVYLVQVQTAASKETLRVVKQ